jgi:hypothetical protein
MGDPTPIISALDHAAYRLTELLVLFGLCPPGLAVDEAVNGGKPWR